MSKPRFEHDCEDCQYHGQLHGYDLYICPHEPTIVARSSSDGPDYRSSDVLAIGGLYLSLEDPRKRESEAELWRKSVQEGWRRKEVLNKIDDVERQLWAERERPWWADKDDKEEA